MGYRTRKEKVPADKIKKIVTFRCWEGWFRSY